MSGRYVGESVSRNEDARLLTGHALFVDDVQLAGMLHVAFVRSDYAHAVLHSVDVSAALERPGVVAVYTAADLGDYWRPGPLLVPPPPIEGIVFNRRTQVPLAKDKRALRRRADRDGRRREPLHRRRRAGATSWWTSSRWTRWSDLEAALGPDAPLVHEQLGSNRPPTWCSGKGDYAAAKAKAAVVVSRRFHYDRGASAAIENRAVVAQWDAQARGADHLGHDAGAHSHPQRAGGHARAAAESQVRVVAPFVGGGFGPKIMMFYPEEVLVPWAAMRLGRPVKWTEDRQENFYATTQERGQVHDAEMALTRDGRILGIQDIFLFDTGAYDPYGLTMPINSQCTLLGPYDVPNYESRVHAPSSPTSTRDARARRRAAARRVRHASGCSTSRRGRSASSAPRSAAATTSCRTTSRTTTRSCSRTSGAAGLRQRQLPPALETALEMIGWERLRGRAGRRRRARAGRWASASSATWKEPGSARTRAPASRSSPSGTCPRRDRRGDAGAGALHRRSRRSWPRRWAWTSTNVNVVTGDTREFNWGTGTFASRGAVGRGQRLPRRRGQGAREDGRGLCPHPQRAEGEIELVDGTARVRSRPSALASRLGDLAVQAPTRCAAPWRREPSRGWRARPTSAPTAGQHRQRRPRVDRRGGCGNGDGRSSCATSSSTTAAS